MLFVSAPLYVSGAREAFARVRAACAAVGRDPDEVVYSAMVGVLIAETPSDLRDRVRAVVDVFGGDADAEAWLAERRGRWILGTLDEAEVQIRALEAAGTERIMLQNWLPRDLDMIGLLGRLATG